MFTAINQYDLEMWKAICACLLGMTGIITPCVFLYFRREQTIEWKLAQKEQDLEFQHKMLQQPTEHLKFENTDADPSS